MFGGKRTLNSESWQRQTKLSFCFFFPSEDATIMLSENYEMFKIGTILAVCSFNEEYQSVMI